MYMYIYIYIYIWRHRPQTLVRTDLAASQWQRHVSHIRPHTSVSGEKQNSGYPPSTVHPWFRTLWHFPISENEIEAGKTPVRYYWGDPGRIAESVWHSDRKGLPGIVPKMEETVGPVSTCGRGLLREWRRPIGFMVSFIIFKASFRNILDQPSYIYIYIYIDIYEFTWIWFLYNLNLHTVHLVDTVIMYVKCILDQPSYIYVYVYEYIYIYI